jgi:hypothetical protein
VYELSYEQAVHTNVIRDINPCLPSSLEFAYTHKGMGFSPDNYSLLEINLDRVRLLYLQRATMTLVSLIRDHFIKDFNQAISNIRGMFMYIHIYKYIHINVCTYLYIYMYLYILI